MQGTKKIIRGTLNEQQEQFCQLYTGDSELFGNGVQSYLEVYDIDRSKPNWYKTACIAASRLLGNVKVINRIRDLLSEGGFNDLNVEKQHTFLINQHVDLSVKQRALADYYKLKGKYEPDSLVIKLMKQEEVENLLKNLEKI